eukprot:3003256-Pleurochrysis_carterae.AAC.1
MDHRSAARTREARTQGQAYATNALNVKCVRTTRAPTSESKGYQRSRPLKIPTLSPSEDPNSHSGQR